MPNPSFENYTTCPYSFWQIQFASPWFSADVNGGTTYYNECSTNNYASVPNNFEGYQYPHTGKAYGDISLYDYAINAKNAGREYIETKLTNPLIAGKRYCVSFYISLTNNSEFASDAVGAYFSIDN